jgi:hypothetical protein
VPPARCALQLLRCNSHARTRTLHSCRSCLIRRRALRTTSTRRS